MAFDISNLQGLGTSFQIEFFDNWPHVMNCTEQKRTPLPSTPFQLPASLGVAVEDKDHDLGGLLRGSAGS